MRASADGKEWVVYKRYAQGTAAMLELRRIVLEEAKDQEASCG